MKQQAANDREQRQSEWAQRVEGFARDAAPRTRPFAEALVDFVAPHAGDHILDVATGSGTVAIAAAKRVGPDGSVLAADFIPEWEPHVVATATAAGVSNISFAVMPAEKLDQPDGSFDVVLCQFGLMFVEEYVQTLREFGRVLRPGGTLGIAVWSVPEKVGVFLLSRLIMAALPPPPNEPTMSPLALSEPGLIERLVAEAGFQDIVVERPLRTYEVPSAEEEWRRWSEDPLSPAARGLSTLPAAERTRLHDEAIAALEAFREDGVIRVPSEAILVKARRNPRP